MSPIGHDITRESANSTNIGPTQDRVRKNGRFAHVFVADWDIGAPSFGGAIG